MPRISAEKRAEIVAAYLENDGATYKEIGAMFGINHITVGKIIREEVRSGNGIKPDRRAKPEPPDYMQYVTPLVQRKHELEQKVEHKQVELEKAKQELRDFTATLRQLMEDTV